MVDSKILGCALALAFVIEGYVMLMVSVVLPWIEVPVLGFELPLLILDICPSSSIEGSQSWEY